MLSTSQDIQNYLQKMAIESQSSEAYIFKLYALEGIVRRIALHPQKHEVILRGSLITRVWALPHYRPVDDIDFLFDYAFDDVRGIKFVQDIFSYQVEDFITYLPEKIEIVPTWVETPLPGARAFIPAEVFGQTFTLQIDLAYDDPLVPPAVLWEYPMLLPNQKVVIYTIRPELACAWKVHGLFEFWNRRSTAWEMKDLYDIYLIINAFELDEAAFAEALEIAFSNRGTPMHVYKRVLEGVFGQSKGSQKNWEKFVLKRQNHLLFDNHLSLLGEVRAFLDKFFIDACKDAQSV